jgi:hypothetical protein
VFLGAPLPFLGRVGFGREFKSAPLPPNFKKPGRPFFSYLIFKEQIWMDLPKQTRWRGQA